MYDFKFKLCYAGYTRSCWSKLYSFFPLNSVEERNYSCYIFTKELYWKLDISNFHNNSFFFFTIVEAASASTGAAAALDLPFPLYCLPLRHFVILYFFFISFPVLSPNCWVTLLPLLVRMWAWNNANELEHERACDYTLFWQPSNSLSDTPGIRSKSEIRAAWWISLTFQREEIYTPFTQFIYAQFTIWLMNRAHWVYKKVV